MRRFTRQVECPQCANSRVFVQHGDTSQRLIGRDTVGVLSGSATLSCGCCGSFNLVTYWVDAAPHTSAIILGYGRAATAGPMEQ